MEMVLVLAAMWVAMILAVSTESNAVVLGVIAGIVAIAFGAVMVAG